MEGVKGVKGESAHAWHGEAKGFGLLIGVDLPGGLDPKVGATS